MRSDALFILILVLLRSFTCTSPGPWRIMTKPTKSMPSEVGLMHQLPLISNPQGSVIFRISVRHLCRYPLSHPIITMSSMYLKYHVQCILSFMWWSSSER